jgi:hypothetical protein
MYVSKERFRELWIMERQLAKRYRYQFWAILKELEDAADHRHLQCTVTDWYQMLLLPVGGSVLAESPAHGVDGLWHTAPIAQKVVGLRDVAEVFAERGVGLLPIWFLRKVGVALNNASVITYDLPKQPPLVGDHADDPTGEPAEV